MQTIGVVDPVAHALLPHLLVLAHPFPGGPSWVSVREMKLLDASLFFARSMAGLRRALQYPYEYWSTSGEKNLRLSRVVDPVSCA
jgi:hypothetical protein